MMPNNTRVKETTILKLQETINAVQNLFDETFSIFVFNNDFRSALVYNNLLESFNNTLEDNKLESNAFLSKLLYIYKELTLKKALILN